MKKAITVLSIIVLFFTLAGCRTKIPNIETSDIASGQTDVTQSSVSSDTTKIDTRHIAINYYGMTINDVAKIWGSDYTLNDYLISGGLASIEYTDYRCPFRFCYSALDIPTSCSGEEKITCVIVQQVPDAADYFITENINAVISYNDLVAKLNGEYFIDELNGGYTFVGDISENIMARFNWNKSNDDKNDDYVITRVYFSY